MSIKVLFVCLGNICRSPTADGVFRAQLAKAQLTEKISVDSAGTADWNIGNAPDPRTVAAASLRGYDLAPLRARQVSTTDFENFDYILAMDNDNLANLRKLAPANYAGHLGLFLEFAQQHRETEVPDPYHLNDAGFEQVLDMVEDASAGLLTHICQRL